MAKLLGYDYEILYKPGEKNYATDALSRVVGSPSLYTLFAPQVELWEEIKKKKKMAVGHSYMEKICKMATKNPKIPYSWRNGLVLYKNQVVVPLDSHIIP